MQIDIIGVPVDLGADRRGVDMGPSAIRYAHLQSKLEDLGHTVERGQPLAQLHRRALDVGKHVGQPVVLVERIARALERFMH